jgi:3-methyladenine DNA glycosylase AlkD
MDFKEVMSELERLGTEQNRKIYRRHGAGDPLFGVSFAHVNTLQKRIKRDQALAVKLWATGNADARTLATMIADPGDFTMDQLDAWLSDVRYYVLVDLLVKYVASNNSSARELMKRWIASGDEWVGRGGWNLLGHLAAGDPSLPDAFFAERLAVIETSIHGAKNRTREAMNGALINIGARNAALRDKALTVARRIGKVEVDHGETGCKTPDASGYIEKMWSRKKPAGKKKMASAGAGKAAAAGAAGAGAKKAGSASEKRVKASPGRGSGGNGAARRG